MTTSVLPHISHGGANFTNILGSSFYFGKNMQPVGDATMQPATSNGTSTNRRFCRQILNVIFRKLHPYTLSNGQLFSLLVMQQKLDPGIPSPALISDFLAPNWSGKMILHIMASNTYFWTSKPYD